MTTTDTRSTKELFRQWRSGDAEAGQTMAQRFADWYYAIATSRLGEQAGREPCETACARFGEGVVKQSDARALVKWAHEIIQEEVQKAGSRTKDGNEASAYTGGKPPKDMLVKARRAHATELGLLESVYNGGKDADPHAVLKARYKIKQWLRNNGVPMEVAPDEPVLDRAPLPLFESGRMASPAEEANFEQWMLSDLDLCKDIAEFSQFAIALRGGLPADAPQGAQSVVTDDEDLGMGTAGKAAIGGAALALVAGGGVLLLIVVLAVLYFVAM